MADYAPMSEIRRPAVSVLIVRGRSVDLQSVFWGMEEEGIPFEVQECPSGEAVGVAKEAAQMSPLNVGAAVWTGRRERCAASSRSARRSTALCA